MAERRIQVPDNIVRATLLLALLLVGGLMLTVWQNYHMAVTQRHELQRAEQATTPMPKTPKHEIVRKREQIAVQPTAAPMTVTPSEKTPVISHVQTTEPVVFLTIDDGIHKNKEVAEYMIERQLPVTAFLTIHAIENDFSYFAHLAKNGTSIQNHTTTHPTMPKHPYDTQKNEICSTSDVLEGKYGKRPKLFRPPYGDYNDDTLRAAAVCGIKATVTWNVVVQNGALNYQMQPGLKPGDIILLHYRPELKADLEATLRSIREQGYKIGHLEDWIQ